MGGREGFGARLLAYFVYLFLMLVFGFVGEFDGTYPRLDGAQTKAAPLKGELRYKLPVLIEGTKLRAGQVLRFEISILDRGLHQSNVITTPNVVVGP